MFHGARFLEHVLGKRTLVEAGGCDGGDLVEAAGAQAFGQGDGLGRAIDVADPLALGVGLHVVDGGQVKEVIDFTRVLLDPGGLDPQLRLAEVALDGNDLVVVRAPQFPQSLHLGQGTGAHQQVDDAAPVQELGYQEASDKTSTAGDKVVHIRSSFC